MIRVGLVGCGFVSEAHMIVYSLIPDANVVAVADALPERGEVLAKKFGVERTFSNHHDLLASESLDLIDICTPTSTHAVIAQDAAREGCHVLVEKPMARTSRECVEMADEARRNGVKLSVCHNLLFHPVIGRLGRIAEIEGGIVALRTFFRTSASQVAQRAGWMSTQKEGGILWDMGCHAAYVHNHFLGEVSEVHAVAKKVFTPVEDFFLVLVRSREGMVGEMSLLRAPKETAWRVEVDTLEGDMYVANLRKDHLERRAIPFEGYVQENLSKLIRELKVAFDKRVVYSLKLLLGGAKFAQRSHYLLIEKMLESIREPEVSPPVRAEEGLAAVKLLEKIESALAEGRGE